MKGKVTITDLVGRVNGKEETAIPRCVSFWFGTHEIRVEQTEKGVSVYKVGGAEEQLIIYPMIQNKILIE